MTTHTVRAYDNDLAALDRIVAEMGGLCEDLLADAVGALERRDPARGIAAAARDRVLELRERALQELAVLTIARRQPMANDLRHIMTAMKIAGDLERIGDLAKNIAKRAVAVAHETPPRSLMTGISHMAEIAGHQLRDVLDAYATRDTAKALTVWREDSQLDRLYNSVFREMLTYMMEDPRNIGLCTHLLFGAKNIERIGDHTTNIAENIHFLVHGTTPDGARPKSDDTSDVVLPTAGAAPSPRK
jgi:phosphate transport system protein